MKNDELAERLVRLADLMEIRGDDYFKIRSYRNAAEVISDWTTPLEKIASEEGQQGLQTLPGVGKAISGKIIEILEKGTFDAWEKLISKTPVTALDLLTVDGIGIKTAATLFQKFKIASLENLKEFVEGGGLATVDGIGERSEQRIRESLARL